MCKYRVSRAAQAKTSQSKEVNFKSNVKIKNRNHQSPYYILYMQTGMSKATTPTDTLAELSLAPSKENDKVIQVPEWLKPYRQTICAYTASLMAVSFGFPLDSVKTRQQTYKYKNVMECIKRTYKFEGIGGFYRGIMAPLLSTSLVRACSISVYSYSLPHTLDFTFNYFMINPPEDNNNSSTSQRILRTTPGAFMAGSIAGASCVAIAGPFEFTKLASQLDILVQQTTNANANAKPRSTFQVAKTIIKRNGLLSLYSGFRYHIFRDSLGSGMYFAIYDGIKVGISSLLDSKQHPASIAVAGGLAGTISWLFIYPIDTFKSRMQKDIYSQSLGFPAAKPLKFSQVLHGKMYRGLGVSLARTSLLGMMFFSCYEQMIKMV